VAALREDAERGTLDVAAAIFGRPDWRIDGAHSNSHAVWRALGAPQDPSDGDLRAIQARQELERLEPDQTVAVRDGVLTLRLALPLPSVSLLEIGPAMS